MSEPRANRRGATSRALLLAIVVAALAALAIVWIRSLQDDLSSTETAMPELADGTSGDEALTELPGTETERRAAGRRGELRTAGGLVIPVGVRLAGPGRLEGRVLDVESRTGVNGARVDLFTVPPAGRNLLGRIFRLAKFGDEATRRIAPAAVAATDAEGHFRFEGVRTGRYFLEARSAWHVPDSLLDVRVDTAGGSGAVEAFVRLGGRVLGVVHHPDGRPASGAKVTIFPGPGSFLTRLRGGDYRAFEQATERDGSFLFVGIPPGEGWEIAASSPGITLSHRAGITVVAGEDVSVELTIRQGGTVEGRVLSVAEDEEGRPQLRPLEGAHLGVVPRGLRDLHFAEEIFETTHATSDPSGAYRLENCPPGELDVIAFAEGHLPTKSRVVRVPPGTTVRAEDIELRTGPMVLVRTVGSGGVPIPGVHASWWVADWDESEFEISFAPFLLQAVEGFEYPISGENGELLAGPFPGDPPHRIAFWKTGYRMTTHAWEPEEEGDEIVVVLEAGGAVEGIVMDAVRAEPVTSFTISGMDRLETDPEAPTSLNPFSGGQLVENPEGRFRVDSVAPGQSELTFSSPGYLSEIVTDIAVVEGQVTRGVIVQLRPGGTIRGRVVDPEGEPVSGAQVLARNERGRPRSEWNRRPRMGANSRRARANQDFGIEMMEMASSLGAVGPGAVTSGPDGAFEILGLRAGPVSLTAHHRDFAAGGTEGLEVPENEPLEGIEITLSRGAGIHGTVEDRHGEPVVGAIVVAATPDGFDGPVRGSLPVWQGESNAEGAYRIEHLPGGSYFVLLTRGDEALNPMSFLGTLNFDLVNVPENEMVRFDIIDSSAAGCRVYGRITAAGMPVAGGGLFALGFESENVLGIDVKIAQVKGDGTYEFEGLAPGFYQLRYGGAGRDREQTEVQLEVEVPDEPSWRLDIFLPEGGVQGRVVSARDGAPVEGAEVALLRSDGVEPSVTGLLGTLLSSESRKRSARTDEDGAFSILRLQEGTYELSVVPPLRGNDANRFAPAPSRTVKAIEGIVETGIEIELEPSLSLAGVVLGADSGPISGAEVRAYPRGGGLRDTSRASSDEDGRFSLGSLAPGTYDVGARAEGWADPPLVEVTLPRDEELVIELRRGVEVSVLVRGPDGAPVQGATGRLVRLDGRGTPASTDAERALVGLLEGGGISGPEGTLELGRYDPGSYRLEVRRGGRTATLEDVVVKDGGSTVLEVILE